MLVLLVGAAVRSLVLAGAVWLGLRVPALRYTRLQLTVWTTVLAAALFMPVGTEIASALLPSVPVAPTSIPMILEPGGSTNPREEVTVVAARDLPGSSAAPTEDRGIAPMPSRRTGAVRWPGGRTIASLIYAIVCGGLLARLAVGLVLAARIARAATPLSEHWPLGPDVRLSPIIRAPATFGSIILLPHDCLGWSQTKRRAVVAHEAAHAERHHFHIQLAASLHCAIFWFSPLSWWLRRKLAYLAETACDDDAILALQDRSAYAVILLGMSGQAPELPACVPMARPATVRARVRRILAGTEAQVPAYACRHINMIGCVLPLFVMAVLPVTANPSIALPVDHEQQSPHRPIKIDPKLLDADVGYYADIHAGSLMIVTREGNHLLTRRLNGPSYANYPYSDHDFFLIGLPQTNHFVTNASGVAIRVIHSPGDSLGRVFDRVSTKTASQMKAQYDRRVAEELQPHQAIKLDADGLVNYEGYYQVLYDPYHQVSRPEIIAITREGNQLFAQAIGDARFPVFPYTDRDFFYTSAAAQITFVKPANGIATALILHKDGKDQTAPRVSSGAAKQMQQRLADERKPHVRVFIDGALLDRYAGRYTSKDMSVMIARDGNHLLAQVNGYYWYSIYPYTSSDFFATSFPTQFTFITNKNGKVIQLVRHSYGLDKVVRRVDQTDCRTEAGCASTVRTD